jgi:hypothetical protein
MLFRRFLKAYKHVNGLSGPQDRTMQGTTVSTTREDLPE